MHPLKNRALAVVAGAVVVVGGADLTAYAAGGHGLFAAHQAGGTPTAAHLPGAHAYEYVIPRHTKVPFEFQAKDLPQGRYSVALSIATRVTDKAPDFTASPFCYVAGGGTTYAVVSYGVLDVADSSGGTEIAINTGSGLVKVGRTGGARITCVNANGTFNSRHSKNVVVFTPLSKVTVGKTHRLAVASKAAPAGFGH